MGERGDRRENQALDLHQQGKPLKAALGQIKKEYDLECAKKQEARKRHYAEQEDNEFKEREPFEFFAEFLLGNTPGLELYDSTNYEPFIRHLKNCRLNKLATAVEKMKAEWDAVDEQTANLA